MSDSFIVSLLFLTMSIVSIGFYEINQTGLFLTIGIITWIGSSIFLVFSFIKKKEGKNNGR